MERENKREAHQTISEMSNSLVLVKRQVIDSAIDFPLISFFLGYLYFQRESGDCVMQLKGRQREKHLKMHGVCAWQPMFT